MPPKLPTITQAMLFCGVQPPPKWPEGENPRPHFRCPFCGHTTASIIRDTWFVCHHQTCDTRLDSIGFVARHKVVPKKEAAQLLMQSGLFQFQKAE